MPAPTHSANCCLRSRPRSKPKSRAYAELRRTHIPSQTWVRKQRRAEQTKQGGEPV